MVASKGEENKRDFLAATTAGSVDPATAKQMLQAYVEELKGAVGPSPGWIDHTYDAPANTGGME